MVFNYLIYITLDAETSIDGLAPSSNWAYMEVLDKKSKILLKDSPMIMKPFFGCASQSWMSSNYRNNLNTLKNVFQMNKAPL